MTPGQKSTRRCMIKYMIKCLLALLSGPSWLWFHRMVVGFKTTSAIFFFRYTVLLQDVEDYVLLHAWVFTKIFT
jgi:hypothetical protein